MEAGSVGQGKSSIAIGGLAGRTSQHANTIIFNASGVDLASDGTDRWFVDPVRNNSSSSFVLGYDLTTKEVSYKTATEETFMSNVNLSRQVKNSQIESIYFKEKSLINIDNDIDSSIHSTDRNEQQFHFGHQNYFNGVSVQTRGSSTWISYDGINYDLVIIPDFNEYNIATNGVIWVVSGLGNSNTSSIAYSYDLVSWEYAIFDDVCTYLTYANGIFMSVRLNILTTGVYSSIMSIDGINWVGSSDNNITDSRMDPFYYKNDTWFQSFHNDFGTNKISLWRSLNNGDTWSQVVTTGITGTANVNGMATNGDIIIAITSSNVYYSYTGLDDSWYTSPNGYGESVIYDGCRFITVSQDAVNCWASIDGINWVDNDTVISSTLRCINLDGKIYTAVSFAGDLLYSTSGTDWSKLSKSTVDFFTYNLNSQSKYFPPNRKQYIKYPSQRIVSVGSGTNTLAYSDNDGNTWTVATTTLTIGKCIAHNGKMWIAGGTGSTDNMTWSNDGKTWFGMGKPLFSTSCNGIVWADNKWVAVGEGTNTTGYSFDGFTWFSSTALFTTAGNDVIYTDSYFVACGNSTTGGIIYSLDGLSWSIVQTDSSNILDMAWTGSMLLAVGTFTGADIAYSYDGQTWVTFTEATFGVNTCIGWNNGLFVMGGTDELSYSEDGFVWTAGSSITGTCNKVKWMNNQWVVMITNGTNTIRTSSNGKTWTARGVTAFTTSGFDISKQISYIHYTQPMLGFGPTALINYSEAGNLWKETMLTSDLFTSVNAAAWNGTIWVAAGAGTNTLAYSYDGKKWVGLGATILSSVGSVVIWDGSQFLAAGNGSNNLATSPDGINWVGQTVTGFTNITGIAWNRTTYVVSGAGATNTLAYSTDAASWTGLSTTVTDGTAGQLIYNNDRFVVTGPTSAYSTNGISWTDITTVPFTTTNGISWNGTIYIACGDGATETIAYSTDNLATWTEVTDSATDIMVTPSKLVYDGTRFLITTSASETKLGSSYDGILWNPISTTQVINNISVRPTIGSVFINRGNVLEPKSYMNFSNTTRSFVGNMTASVEYVKA